jgi:hypothetical protein
MSRIDVVIRGVGVLVVAGVLATGSYVVGDGGAGPADYYVSTTGSDSNPGTQGSPFLTMDKCADQAQSSAKTCELATGTYSAQTLNRSAGTRTALITFRPAAGGSVTINGISNGTNGGSSDKAQDFVKVDGSIGSLTINGSFQCWWNSGGAINDIYLNDITVTDTSSAGDLISCGDTTNFTLSNSTIGPACCRGVGVGMGKSAIGSPGNSNHIYRDNTIFGLWDTCVGASTADDWPTEYGSCSGTGFADWVAGGMVGDEPRHIDGIQLVDCDNCTVERNRVYRMLGASSQGIYIHANNNGTFANPRVVNNMVAGMRQGGIVIDGGGGTVSGTITVAHNAMAGDNTGFTLGWQTVQPGTTVIVAGNIGDLRTTDSMGDSTCSVIASDSSTITPVWNNSNSPFRSCHSDTLQAATFVSATHPYDLSLQAGSQGIDDADAASICGSGFTVTDDIFGTPRFLGVRCDDGAHEKE